MKYLGTYVDNKGFGFIFVCFYVLNYINCEKRSGVFKCKN